MKELISALADWIEDKVRDRKLRWIVSVPSALASLLAIVGIAASIQPLANLSLLTLSVFLFAVVVVLSVNRRYMRRELGATDQILRAYGEQIRLAQETDHNLFHTKNWSERVSVSQKGDAVIMRDITVEIGPRPVRAIWSLSTRNSDDHLSSSVRDSVRVSAQYLNADGTDGTNIVTTASWEESGKLRTYLYFDREVPPHETVRLRLTLRWPRYAADILDGGTEVNHWLFRRTTDSFESTVLFEKSFSSRKLRITPLEGSSTPEITRDPASGQTEIYLNLDKIEVDREYGYRIDLQRDGAS